MNVQRYSADDFMDMDALHDHYVTDISLDNNTLIIKYDHLDWISGPEGLPQYEYKSLAIKYDFRSFCDVTLFYENNKYKCIDLLKKKSVFDKLTKKFEIQSYKYSVDSFGEITMHFWGTKYRKNSRKILCSLSMEIHMDAKEISYYWN